eukprot:RCo014020
MANDVTLSSSIRSNLLTLQSTGAVVDRTNARLSSGQKVSSAIDDAVAYFQAKGLSDRAADLTGRKDGIDQGISSLKSAITGLENVEKILVQMKGVALSAKSANATDRANLATQFKTLSEQMNNLVNDTSYQGLNLVNATSANIKVQFSDKTAAFLKVDGVNVQTSNLAGISKKTSQMVTGLAGSKWSAVATTTASSPKVSVFDNVIKALDSAITKVRSNTKNLGTNVALLQTRLDFTKSYVNNLTEGSNKLTLADLNEEGANLVSLRTRQQLGIQALSFAGQQEQGVLSLFR